MQRFRELLEKRTTNEYLVPARQLYDQIIRPLVPVLEAHHVDTLVVIPDEVLRIVPFAALNDGSGFLVDHYATAIAPSLKLVEPKPLAPGSGAALVLGISQSVQGYVDLPNVPREVSAVHAIEGGDVLLNDAFTRARFESELRSGRYNIVHVASHGQFGSDPSRTFVLAFDGPLTMDDLEADIKYGRTAREPARIADPERVRDRQRRRPRGTRSCRCRAEGRGAQRVGDLVVHQRRCRRPADRRFLRGAAARAG